MSSKTSNIRSNESTTNIPANLEDNGDTTSQPKMQGHAFFPLLLHDIVSDERNSDIIRWLPDGKAFIVVDKKRFSEELLPLHFSQHCKFSSFTRKLSRWHFKRVPRGPLVGTYYNILFQKSNRKLCYSMNCRSKPPFPSSCSGTLGAEAISCITNPKGLLNALSMLPIHQVQEQQKLQGQNTGPQIVRTTPYSMNPNFRSNNLFESNLQRPPLSLTNNLLSNNMLLQSMIGIPGQRTTTNTAYPSLLHSQVGSNSQLLLPNYPLANSLNFKDKNYKENLKLARDVQMAKEKHNLFSSLPLARTQEGNLQSWGM